MPTVSKKNWTIKELDTKIAELKAYRSRLIVELLVKKGYKFIKQSQFGNCIWKKESKEGVSIIRQIELETLTTEQVEILMREQ